CHRGNAAVSFTAARGAAALARGVAPPRLRTRIPFSLSEFRALRRHALECAAPGGRNARPAAGARADTISHGSHAHPEADHLVADARRRAAVRGRSGRAAAVFLLPQARLELHHDAVPRAGHPGPGSRVLQSTGHVAAADASGTSAGQAAGTGAETRAAVCAA